MPLSSKLDRKLRALEESTDDEEYYEVTDRSTSPSVIDTGADGAEVLSSEEEQEEEDEDNVQAQMSQVSFGALAKAQDALQKQQSADRKRKRGEETSRSQDDKLQALRQRLQQIKAARMVQDGPPAKKSKSSKKAVQSNSEEDDDDDDDDDDDESTDSSDSDAAPRARKSKHAPAVQSSKKAVSRKRQVVEVKKRVSRDPRFDPVTGPKPDQHAIQQRYAFLKDYKKSEMAELRDAIKKTKNEADKAKLKRKLESMESQMKAQERKDKEHEVLREHKKKEKELVKQGKQPFFLKKSDQKQLALIDRFQNMKSKDRDRAIERRRKKATAKERKNMPDARRMA